MSVGVQAFLALREDAKRDVVRGRFDAMMDENFTKFCDLIWVGLGKEAIAEMERLAEQAHAITPDDDTDHDGPWEAA